MLIHFSIILLILVVPVIVILILVPIYAPFKGITIIVGTYTLSYPRRGNTQKKQLTKIRPERVSRFVSSHEKFMFLVFSSR